MAEVYVLEINAARRRESKPSLPELQVGRRMEIIGGDLAALANLHGLVGHYRVGLDAAGIEPVSTSAATAGCFVWDADTHFPAAGWQVLQDGNGVAANACRVKDNACVMTGMSLSGPDLVEVAGETRLILSPRFDLEFTTDAYAACLGVVHLVTSTRFITLANGRKIPLIDTGEDEGPVLYLEDERDKQAVKPVAEYQASGLNETHTYSTEIRQVIPERVAGETVETVTVLEQYTSYFMQRQIADDEADVIWTPVCAPVGWGWSIRVGRRTDGPWGIVRRKVMLPIAGHDGLELPVWEKNIHACSGAAVS